MLNYYENLQISVPIHAENWDPDNYAPLVTRLNDSFDEKSDEVLSAYNQRGEEYSLSVSKEPDKPVIVLKESERVDSDGMLRVDMHGFVIPQEARKVSARSAYDNYKKRKSGREAIDPIIVKVDDNSNMRVTEDDCYEFYDAYYNGWNENMTCDYCQYFNCPDCYDLCTPQDGGDGDSNGLTHKNCVQTCDPPTMPTINYVQPLNPYSIKIDWQSHDSGDDTYEIWRSVDGNLSELYKIVENHPTEFIDEDLTSGVNYSYEIKAHKCKTCDSPLTPPKDAYATWRKNNLWEKIDKIFISKGCWNWCVSWPDGKIELKFRVIYYDIENESVSLPQQGLPQTRRKDLKGEWETFDKDLFRWDVTKNTYNYALHFHEDDKKGDGTEISFGVDYKINESTSTSADIKFKISEMDEDLGFFLVYHYDNKGKHYRLSPRKGFAKVMVSQ